MNICGFSLLLLCIVPPDTRVHLFLGVCHLSVECLDFVSTHCEIVAD